MTRNRTIAVLLAIIMVLSVFAIGGAMVGGVLAGSVTDDGDISSANDTVEDFNASSDENSSVEYWTEINIQFDNNSADDVGEVGLEIEHDGIVHHSITVDADDLDNKTREVNQTFSLNENTTVGSGLQINVTAVTQDTDATADVTAVDADETASTGAVNEGQDTTVTVDGVDVTVEVVDAGDDEAQLNVTWRASYADFEVDHSDLQTLPGQPGENTTTEFNFEEGDNNETANVTLEVDFVFGDERNVMYAADGTADFDLFDHTERERGILGMIPFISEEIPDHYALEGEERIVAGDNTTVYVYLADDDLADDYDETVGEKSSGDVAFSLGAYEGEENNPMFVFYDSPDTDLVDEDDDTYAVYDSGANVLEIHLGSDDYADSESIELHAANFRVSGFDDVGFLDLREAFGTLNALRFSGVPVPFLSILFGSGLFAGGVAVTRRRHSVP